MKNNKRIVLLVMLGVFLPCSLTFAQANPPIFVSSFNFHHIQRIDGSTVTIIHTDDREFPEGMVVGPDGKLYVCEGAGFTPGFFNRIIRMNQDGTQVEPVYLKVGSAGPNAPEGPSFSPSGALFFNTRQTDTPHNGVWKITGASRIPFGGTFPAPVLAIPPSGPGGTGITHGEGTTFTANGDLLIVGRSLLPDPAIPPRVLHS